VIGIDDNEIISEPVRGDGSVLKIKIFKRDGEPFTNNPTISDVIIKACYEYAEGKYLCMTSYMKRWLMVEQIINYRRPLSDAAPCPASDKGLRYLSLVNIYSEHVSLPVQ